MYITYTYIHTYIHTYKCSYTNIPFHINSLLRFNSCISAIKLL